jgi:MFS family permease
MAQSILSTYKIAYPQNISIWATFYISTVLSSIIGSLLSRKVGQNKFLFSWTIAGVIISLLPALFTSGSFGQVWALSLLFGASFGLGVPSCLAYFKEVTVVENRGRIGAIALLIANLIVPFLAYGFSFETVDLTIISVVFALIRGLGLVIAYQEPETLQQPPQVNKSPSFLSIISDRTFLLYFVAWSMFSLVDSFERVLVNIHVQNQALLETMSIMEPLVAAISIIIVGVLCDWIGRKKIVLSGFVALGVAYGIIGLAYGMFEAELEALWYLYFIVDGIAWGIFLLIFFVILWGDIAKSYNSEKYYTIGSIPYFLSSIIPELLRADMVKNINLSAAFSVASFFLFVAVMPLVFAPETLPEKKMELRRLRSFAEEARKMKEKYEEN